MPISWTIPIFFLLAKRATVNDLVVSESILSASGHYKSCCCCTDRQTDSQPMVNGQTDGDAEKEEG
jgi:hypothetical protein